MVLSAAVMVLGMVGIEPASGSFAFKVQPFKST